MSDKIIVSRDNQPHQIDMTSSGSLRDTDLVLVSREVNGVPTLFKATGDRFGSPSNPPNITAVNLTQNDTNQTRFTSNSFTSNVSGIEENPLAVTTMTAEVSGSLSIEAATQPITSNGFTKSTDANIPLTLEGSFNLGDVFAVDDVVQANESYTPTTDTISSVTSTSAWNQDALWSNSLTCNQGFFGSRPKEDAFDGTTSEYAASSGTAGDITFTSPVAFPAGCKVEVWCNTSSNARHDVFVNGGAKQVVPGGEWVELTYNAGDEAAFVIIIRDDGSGNTNFNAIRINGLILVDSNVPGPAPAGPSKIINLPTEKDIQLFQAGDIVQADSNYVSIDSSRGTVGDSGIYGSWAHPFNGVIGTGSDSSNFISPVGSGESNWCSIEFAYAIPVTSTVKVYGLIEYEGAIALNDSFNVPAAPGAYGSEVVVAASSIGNELRKITVKRSGTGGYFAGVKVDDKLVIDPNVSNISPNDVKVVATDVSAKTITVDGGDWRQVNSDFTWSQIGSISAGSTPANLPVQRGFNGQLNNQTEGDTTGSVFTLPFTAIISEGDVGFSSYAAGGSGHMKLYNGGTQVDDVLSLGTAAFAYSSYEGPITEIRISRDNRAFEFAAISVFGKTLLDPIDDSKVWSNDTTAGTHVFNTSFGPNKAFDGQTAITTAERFIISTSSPYNVNQVTTITLKGLQAGKTVEFLGKQSPSGAAQVTFNGDVVSGIFTSGVVAGQWNTLGTSVAGDNVMTVGVANPNTDIYAFRVDGVLLVDTGVLGLGDSEVSTATPKRGTGTIKTINGSDVTIEPFTDNCFKEDQYLVFKTPKTITVSPVTEAISSYDSSTRTLTFDTDKDISQFAIDDSIYMSDASGVGTSATLTTDTIIAVTSTTLNDNWYFCASDPSDLQDVLDNGIPYDQQVDKTNGYIVYVNRGSAMGSAAVWTTNGNFGFFTTGADNGHFAANGTRLDSTPSNGGSYNSTEWDDWTYSNSAGTNGSYDLDYYKIHTNSDVAYWKTKCNGTTAGLINGVGDGFKKLKFDSNQNLKYFKTGDKLSTGPYTGFQAKVYASNGGDKIVRNYSFAPDFLWFKCLTDPQSHALFDTTRGIYNRMSTNNNDAEINDGTTLTAFYSDGFEVSGGWEVNKPGNSYIAMAWSAGNGSASSNTKGSIGTSVKADSGRFSIVSYTGSGTEGDTIGHGLGTIPDFAIVKNRGGGSQSWTVYHKALGETQYLALSEADPALPNSNSDKWNDTAFTNEVITLGSSSTVNRGGDPHIAYFWSEVANASKFGSFTKSGAGSIAVGFKPELIIIKQTNGSSNWLMFTENTYAPSSGGWYANRADEKDGTWGLTWTDTGIDYVSGSWVDGDYVFAAFAEQEVLATVESDADLTTSSFIVDGGNWDDGTSAPGTNQAQVWSEKATLTGVLLQSDLGVDKLFDNTDNPCGPGDSTTGGTVTFEPDEAITGAVRIFGAVSNTGVNAVFEVNDTPLSTVSLGFSGSGSLSGTSGQTWITIPGVSSLSKLKFGWNPTLGTSWMKIGKIEVGGLVLFDASGDPKTATTVKEGKGTIAAVSPETKKIVLQADTNGQWVDDYYVATPTKPAISSTAYVKFDGNGIVTGITGVPQLPVPMASRNPTLMFPATFDTGNAPDAELPEPTSLKTIITRTSELGTATGTSNELFPSTLTRSALEAGAPASYTTDGFAEFVCMTRSHEGRAAEQRAIQYAENCQALKDAAEQRAQDYINDNP